jgi:hypothetical protein
MRVRSSTKERSAEILSGVQENAIFQSPVPRLRPHKDYGYNLREIIALPKITGIALLVADGKETECVRSVGDAPPIGSRGQAGVGLTGICFSTGKIELCNDVEKDSRADLQVYADLGVRSVLVVPIRPSSRVAGILEALSSQPNAFDWRTISRIRRIAQAFDPVTLESCVHLTGQQDGVEQVAGRTSEFYVQKVLSSAWLVQNRFCAPVADSDREDCEDELGAAQPDSHERQSVVAAQPPSEELPSKACMDPPAFGAPEHAAASFLRLASGFLGKGRLRLFVLLALAGIVFVCFVEFLTHRTSLSVFLNSTPRVLSAGSRLAAPAESREGLRNGALSHTAPRNDFRATTPPSLGASMPQSFTKGTVVKFQKREQIDDTEANWELALAYLKGVGVHQNERQAAKYLKKAANLGDPRAQAALSDLYLRGAGVQRDYVRAYTWASIAAGQLGGEHERLAALRQRMTKSQLEDANRRLRTWYHAQGLQR